MTGAVVRATRCLLDYGIAHVRGVMPHNEGTMAHPVVDVLSTIDIPFVRAVGTFDKDRKRLHTTVVVGDPVRKKVLGTLKERTRGRKRLTIGLFESHGVILHNERDIGPTPDGVMLRLPGTGVKVSSLIFSATGV